ncbi:MAG TPA: hypothetical protein VLF20_05985 [Patescibacteria group bacterium]|nr:hypothetical protein [Patescibacteria group bacterium]
MAERKYYSTGRNIDTRFRARVRHSSFLSSELPEGTILETKRGFLKHKVIIPAQIVPLRNPLPDGARTVRIARQEKVVKGIHSKRRVLHIAAQEHGAAIGLMTRVISAPIVEITSRSIIRSEEKMPTNYRVEMEVTHRRRTVVELYDTSGNLVDTTKVDVRHRSPTDELSILVQNKVVAESDGTLRFKRKTDSTSATQPTQRRVLAGV